MRAHDTDAWWLRDDIEIIGFEDGDEEDGDEESDEDGDEESEDEESEGDEDGDDDEGSEDEDEDDDKKSKSKKPKENIDGLKSALRKERMARKKLERENRKLKGAKTEDESEDDSDDDKDDKKSDKDSPKLAKEQERNQKLATKLLDNAVDTAIIKQAGEFKDADEVLKLINRKEIEVDQDEDDPTEIEIDEDSVADAIKKLAKKSPHLLKTKEEREKISSGSKFGGRKKTSKEPTDAALKQKYAALRR